MADHYQPYDKDQSQTSSRAGSPTPSTKSTKSVLGRLLQSISKKTKSGLAGALAAVKHKNPRESYWAAAEDEPSKKKEEGGFKTANQVIPTSQPEADGEDMEIGETPVPTDAEIRALLFPDDKESSNEEEDNPTPQAPKIVTPPKNLAALKDLEATPRSPTVVKLSKAEQYALKVRNEGSGLSPDLFISSQPTNLAAFERNIEVSKTLAKNAPNSGMDMESLSPILPSSPILGYESYTLEPEQVKDVLATFMDMRVGSSQREES